MALLDSSFRSVTDHQTHDADLKPEDCGGPIFDLNGNFIGLNIARNSRVRSYAIPRSIVKSLIEKN